ncbi:MAG: hypothetical protein EB130_06140, partial [Actinobacteria bacterium]|nr:hypothetical protein [Actinomycetota bacterium]
MAQVIKAAVARQREFLADASALQFTRNPAGLYAALRKASTRGALQLPRVDASPVATQDADGRHGVSDLARVHGQAPKAHQQVFCAQL